MNRPVFYFFIILFFSCKSDKTEYLGDIEIIFHKEGGSAAYMGEDIFEKDEARNLNKVGIALAKEREFAKADEKFKRALELEPENPILLNNIGNTQHKLKNYYKAIYFFEKSLSASDSTYFNASLNLGLLYWKDYEFEKSAQILEYTISHSNDKFERAFAHLQLAKTYLDMNKCKQAELNYSQAESGLVETSGFKETLKDLKKEVKNCVQELR